MLSKFLFCVSLPLAGLALTGCGDSGKTAMGPEETNVLGIIKHSGSSYEHTGVNTFAIKTDELTGSRDFSGDKTTLFWGFITIEDY